MPTGNDRDPPGMVWTDAHGWVPGRVPWFDEADAYWERAMASVPAVGEDVMVNDAANRHLQELVVASVPIFRARDVAIGVSIGVVVSGLLFMLVYFVAIGG